MSLNPIKIPYSKNLDANEKRYGQASTAYNQCLLCKKPVSPATMRVVVLDSSLGKIIDPKSDEGKGEDNGGCFYVGSDCWRKNPQLHPYEVKHEF